MSAPSNMAAAASSSASQQQQQQHNQHQQQGIPQVPAYARDPPAAIRRFPGSVYDGTGDRPNAIVVGNELSRLAGDPTVLAVFSDGSVTAARHSCGTAYRARSGRRLWVLHGTELHATELLGHSTSARGAEPAELLGITLALDLARKLLAPGDAIARVVVLSDSASRLGHIRKWAGRDAAGRHLVLRAPPEERERMGKIVADAEAIVALGREVELRWVPGHEGVVGNEMANRAATRV